MCGRYALSLRASQFRQRLADQDMPADEAPDDDDVRHTYNFAPGNHGLIYRAHTSDRGAGSHADHTDDGDDGEPASKRTKLSHPAAPTVDGLATPETKYKLQAAKWGLIPFWTKRAPDYASQLRTINCRDDSLAQSGGMWNTMKQRKRCIVIADGFYEWLKKNGGKEKVPHFVKRKDGGLMCFAGLWDCVRYEEGPGAGAGVDGKGEGEGLYTYTVITTDSNPQLKFLHDRMPVILEPGSEAMRRWLDPLHVGWDKELQGMLVPFKGELECYPVDKAVGKVGNNSPSFVVPVDSKENKKNIANFFANQKAAQSSPAENTSVARDEKAEKGQVKQGMKREEDFAAVVKQEPDEHRTTTSDVEDPESNAPLPKPEGVTDAGVEAAMKRETDALDDATLTQAVDEHTDRGIKRDISELDDETLLAAAAAAAAAAKSPPSKESSPSKKPAGRASASPVKGATPAKTRSATTNGTKAKMPNREGNVRITAFFGK
ncbi:hypothetical protein LTR53_014421 [Teratosphaeriaceae sp. CCFEE 6253]|nr:hypothetical protein LTR53_014421 [Teratosphaeriaceae sp. CCFEE 6253]